MKYGSNTNLYGVEEACTRLKHPKGIKSPNHQYLPATFMQCEGQSVGQSVGQEFVNIVRAHSMGQSVDQSMDQSVGAWCGAMAVRRG